MVKASDTAGKGTDQWVSFGGDTFSIPLIWVLIRPVGKSQYSEMKIARFTLALVAAAPVNVLAPIARCFADLGISVAEIPT